MNLKDLLSPLIKEEIKKEGNKYCVYSKSGEKLGTHDTYEKALAQLQAIEANKKKSK